MQYSHSRVESFKSCPYKWKLHYIDKVSTIPNFEPNNALICGNTVHLGAEKDIDEALKFYKSHYNVMTDLHINEIIKFEILIPKIKELLSKVDIYKQEYFISTKRFRGIIDLITNNSDGSVDIFDFKYSNNIEHYLESPQLHIYKYFLEQQGFRVNKLGFIFIPKTGIRQKKTESLYQFRKRLKETVKKSEILVEEVTYDHKKVIEFFDNIIEINEAKDYQKNPSFLCDYCNYEKYCMEGIDYMILPEKKRREKIIDIMPDMHIYGDSYVGKSSFIDGFDDVLLINTDGNIDNTTSPVISIADEVTVEGRMTKRKYAWEVFKDVVTELEKKQNDFKRVAIDLIEDLYEHCRVYMYNRLGIEHEQDLGFGKGWDMIRTEFLSTIKRLKNLGYQIIYISKEVTTEISLKSGAKLTTIKPNINEKIANVLAGTVDLTVRAYIDDDERFLNLKKVENIFGGGRFNFLVDRIPLEKDAFIKALEDAQGKKAKDKKEESTKDEISENKQTTDKPMEETTEEPQKEEKPKRRTRKSKKSE